MKFGDHFWDEELGSFKGWERLLDRLREGRQGLKQYAEFLRER